MLCGSPSWRGARDTPESLVTYQFLESGSEFRLRKCLWPGLNALAPPQLGSLGQATGPTQRPFSSIANEPINKGCPVCSLSAMSSLLPQPFSSFRVQLPLQACSVGFVLGGVDKRLGSQRVRDAGCLAFILPPRGRRSCAQDCFGSPHSLTDRYWGSAPPLGSKPTLGLGAGGGGRNREWAEMNCSWFCLGS